MIIQVVEHLILIAVTYSNLHIVTWNVRLGVSFS